MTQFQFNLNIDDLKDSVMNSDINDVIQSVYCTGIKFCDGTGTR